MNQKGKSRDDKCNDDSVNSSEARDKVDSLIKLNNKSSRAYPRVPIKNVVMKNLNNSTKSSKSSKETNKSADKRPAIEVYDIQLIEEKDEEEPEQGLDGR
jgi:hypothetical protein